MSQQIYAAAVAITNDFVNSGFVKAVGDATSQIEDAIEKFLADENRKNITVDSLADAIKVLVKGGKLADIPAEVLSTVTLETLKIWVKTEIAPLFKPADA